MHPAVDQIDPPSKAVEDNNIEPSTRSLHSANIQTSQWTAVKESCDKSVQLDEPEDDLERAPDN